MTIIKTMKAKSNFEKHASFANLQGIELPEIILFLKKEKKKEY